VLTLYTTPVIYLYMAASGLAGPGRKKKPAAPVPAEAPAS